MANKLGRVLCLGGGGGEFSIYFIHHRLILMRKLHRLYWEVSRFEYGYFENVTDAFAGVNTL